MPEGRVRAKWRPPLALVIAAVCFALVTLPVIGVLLARLGSDQFVRETERSLLAQSVIYGEVFAAAYRAVEPEPEHGAFLEPEQKAERAEDFTPIAPQLSVFRGDVLPPRPDGVPAQRPLRPPYAALAGVLSQLGIDAQRSTLASFRAIDAYGRVIAGTGEIGYDLGHVAEVRAALRGEVGRSVRRKDFIERFPLNSISRNTSYRVYVARPVVVADRVVGAVYLSRTPLDLRKFMFQERVTLGLVAAIMVAGAALLGLLFWRLVAGPMRGLRDQALAVSRGERQAPEPLGHYGVAELADLGGAILSMARALGDRSRTVESYTAHVTHELKSPVTAILGAAELIDTGDEERRMRLSAAIREEAHRMTALLARLRELAQAKAVTGATHTDLGELATGLASDFPDLDVVAEGALSDLPVSREQGEIVLIQLLRNASEHGASRVVLSWDGSVLEVRDNGPGISEANRAKVAEPFFTTRRERGGTGMGLAIVAAVLDGCGGRLETGENDGGAVFRLIFR